MTAGITFNAAAGVAVVLQAAQPTQSTLSVVLDFIARIVEAIAWPVVFLLVLNIVVTEFKPQLTGILKNISEWTIKVGPVELSGKQLEDVIEAAASLGNVAPGKKSDPAITDAEEMTQITEMLAAAVLNRRLPLTSERSILWVDNEPNNIEQERKAFERLNFTTTHTESTDGAIQELKRGEYDLVISDFSRGNDDQAAFTLIDEMRKEDIPTKVVIYTHHTSSEAKTRENPAYGLANSPRELLDLVLQAIQ